MPKFLLAACALLAVGCTSQTPNRADSGPKAPDSYRGHVVIGHEVRSFRHCDGNADYWIIDPDIRLTDLYRELIPMGSPPYGQLFVVVQASPVPAPTEGFGKSYAGAIRISEIRYAAYEGLGCGLDWASFDHRASGNEPFWTVTVVEGEGAELRRPGHQNLRWNQAGIVRTDKGMTYQLRDPTTIPADLTLLRQTCRDTMSGAYSNYRATLTLPDETFQGCAVSGSHSS